MAPDTSSGTRDLVTKKVEEVLAGWGLGKGGWVGERSDKAMSVPTMVPTPTTPTLRAGQLREGGLQGHRVKPRANRSPLAWGQLLGEAKGQIHSVLKGNGR